MNFEDEAIILSVRPHAENGAIIHFLCETNGHLAAYVSGARSRRLRGILQVGEQVSLQYRARTYDQLGQATIEPSGPGLDILDSQSALLAVQSVCLITQNALPENEPALGVFHALKTFVSLLDQQDIWPLALVRYELGLLETIGFGLSLSTCCVSGSSDDLIYVSPRSGRAVSRLSGASYADKLLRLPAFLLSSQAGYSPSDLTDGLILSGYFIEKHIYHHHNRSLPDIRQRLIGTLLND